MFIFCSGHCCTHMYVRIALPLKMDARSKALHLPVIAVQNLVLVCTGVCVKWGERRGQEREG